MALLKVICWALIFIIRISQPNFAILLSLRCSIFNAVIMNFIISKFFKILSIMQSVHSPSEKRALMHKTRDLTTKYFFAT